MKALNILFFLIFLPFLSFSQDAKAEKILNQMSQKYKQLKGFKAEFSYQMTDSKGKALSENINGNIAVKGNKYRLKVKGQEIFNNTKKVWTYMPDDKEVTVSDYDPEDGEISPAQIYTIYQKNYKYVFAETAKIGSSICDVIDLMPLDKKKDIFKIRLFIDQKGLSLVKWEVFEKSSKRYVYAVKKFEESTFKDDYFEFKKSDYPNVEVIDL